MLHQISPVMHFVLRKRFNLPQIIHLMRFVLEKRFRWYQVHFIRRFVPRKRFKWNQVRSMMCFVPRKRFRRNKSRNHTAPQGEVLRTYAGFHSPISRFFVHHVGRFPLPKVSRRHSPRQAGFVHHIDEKKRSGEVAPRSWRDAATTRFGRH